MPSDALPGFIAVIMHNSHESSDRTYKEMKVTILLWACPRRCASCAS
jgi:hypothetical protein